MTLQSSGQIKFSEINTEFGRTSTTSNTSLEDYGLIVDFGNVNWRPLRTRDVQLRTNVIQDGRDGVTNEWMCEAGMEIRNEQTHAVIKLVP